MSSVVAMQPEPAPITACTISRDVRNFDLLIEDMETELGESWGDLSFDDAIQFLGQPDASALHFVAIAVNSQDEVLLGQISSIITTAKDRGIKVILIAEEVSPIALHQLLKLGADGFVPYPLPENALHEAIERLNEPPAQFIPDTPAVSPAFKAKGDRDGAILAVHGLGGGTGATTFAVNLAWELATVRKDNPPRVCILDLDLQYGSVSTYLDLPRREAVFEMLSNTEALDSDSLLQSMLTFNDKLHVLTSPADMLPLDLITSEDVTRVLDLARANFDFVVVDMPKTVVQWSEAVLQQSHVYFATL